MPAAKPAAPKPPRWRQSTLVGAGALVLALTAWWLLSADEPEVGQTAAGSGTGSGQGGVALVLRETKAPVEQRASGDFMPLIAPQAPTVEDDIVILAQSAPAAATAQWFRNGAEISGATTLSLPRGNARKGETVSARVRAGSAEATVEVVIADSPPSVVALPFKDPVVTTGKPLEIVPEGADPDGDPVSFRYQWSINGEVQTLVEGPVLPAGSFRKGDRIQVTVIPSDGELEGKPFHGGGIVVPNAPPAFASSPPLAFRTALYDYQPQVTDPDGDALSFTLEQGPAGMKIDPASGRVTWAIAPEQAGAATVRLVATDSEGMKAVQEFTLNVTINPAGG